MNELKILSLNLRNGVLETEFSARAKAIEELVRVHDPDLIGVQELTDFMPAHLSYLTEHYDFCGEPRGSLPLTNERSAVFFRKDRFRLLKTETVWLSNSPRKSGSKFLYSAYPRILTMARLEDREHAMTFTFANTHLDHLLPIARFKQAKVLMKELTAFHRDSFLVLTGDFNCSDQSAAVRQIINDRTLNLRDAQPAEIKSTIRNVLQAGASGFRPIDHVFVSENAEVLDSVILSDNYLDVHPSDHCPLLVTVRIPDFQ